MRPTVRYKTRTEVGFDAADKGDDPVVDGLIHLSVFPVVLARLSAWPVSKSADHAWRPPSVRRGPSRSAGRNPYFASLRAQGLPATPRQCSTYFGKIGPKHNDSGGFQEIRAEADDTPRPALPHRTRPRRTRTFCETNHFHPFPRRRSCIRSSMATVLPISVPSRLIPLRPPTRPNSRGRLLVEA